jgi:hypothetical protein
MLRSMEMASEDSSVSEWSSFGDFVRQEFGRTIQPAIEAHGEEMGQAIRNTLLDLDGPRIVARKPSPPERYAARLFRGMHEICLSRETLGDIAVYIDRFPYRKTPVTKVRYLRYHIEGYIQEMGVFRFRLLRYLPRIARSFAGETDAGEIKSKVDSLKSLVEDALKNLREIRDEHVHEYRFDPPDLDRLATLHLWVTTGSDDVRTRLAGLYDSTYILTQAKWKELIVANNKQLDILLDRCGSVLIGILFPGKSRKLRYPKRCQ